MKKAISVHHHVNVFVLNVVTVIKNQCTSILVLGKNTNQYWYYAFIVISMAACALIL